MSSVITQQPLTTDQKDTDTVLLKRGPVTVRQLKDTEEDTKFFANLLVEAFEGKIVHATSRSSIPKMQVYMANRLRGRPPEYYERNLVAEYDGEKAGACVLAYHGDLELFPERDEDAPSFGCSDICGLLCMECAIGGEKVPQGKCYLDTIGVDAKFRGKGIGKVLLEVADTAAKRKGCKAIYLKVASDNRAKHLYERHGYVVKGTISRCCCMKCQTGVKEFTIVEKAL